MACRSVALSSVRIHSTTAPLPVPSMPAGIAWFVAVALDPPSWSNRATITFMFPMLSQLLSKLSGKLDPFVNRPLCLVTLWLLFCHDNRSTPLVKDWFGDTKQTINAYDSYPNSRNDREHAISCLDNNWFSNTKQNNPHRITIRQTYHDNNHDQLPVIR